MLLRSCASDVSAMTTAAHRYSDHFLSLPSFHLPDVLPPSQPPSFISFFLLLLSPYHLLPLLAILPCFIPPLFLLLPPFFSSSYCLPTHLRTFLLSSLSFYLTLPPSHIPSLLSLLPFLSFLPSTGAPQLHPSHFFLSSLLAFLHSFIHRLCYFLIYITLILCISFLPPLFCTAPYYAISHYTTLYYTTPHYITPHHTTPRHTQLPHTTL